MKPTNELSKKIRSIRENLGYSQEYVADQMSISQQMYSKIENHPEKTTLEKLKQLAVVFQINVITLLIDDSPLLFIDSAKLADSMTIQSIIETHKQNLEKMTKDISILKEKMGSGHTLKTESK